jgi:hypothetical protein
MRSTPSSTSAPAPASPADATVQGSTSSSAFATLINMAGRQRMLSQKIVLYSLLAADGDAAASAVAREAFELFRASHRSILADSTGSLREELQRADPPVRRFIELAGSAVLGGVGRDRGALTALVELAAPALQALQLATQACENAARRNAQAQKSRHDALMGDIQDIAKEARIVSFNARVMAARAGDVGKEFAVVANVLAGISEQIQALARSAMALD